MQYIKEYFCGIWHNRYVLISLVKQDLQMKYNRSVLGVAWSIITPMGLAVILGLVYSIIFDTDPRVFIPLLFAGINPWSFISGSADGGTSAFLNAEGYIKQLAINPQIFPLRCVIVAFVNLLYSVVAFFAIYLFLSPDAFNPRMLLVFPGLVIIFFAALALANFSAVINLNFRDYQPLQSLIIQGLFYVTPIIFTTDMLDQRGCSFLYKINPIYYFIEVVRTPMLGSNILNFQVYAVAIILVIAMEFISIRMVMKTCTGLALKL